MKKRYLIVLGIIMTLLYGYLFYYFTSSHGTYYSSIKSYIKDNSDTYYDFYDIDSYLICNEKKTLSQINKLKVYYNGDPQDNYNITIKKDNYEITYSMNSYEEIDKDVVLVTNKYPIYVESNDSNIFVSHYLDNNKQLCVSLRKTNKYYDLTHMQETLIQVLEDSIDLNDIY